MKRQHGASDSPFCRLCLPLPARLRLRLALRIRSSGSDLIQVLVHEQDAFVLAHLDVRQSLNDRRQRIDLCGPLRNERVRHGLHHLLQPHLVHQVLLQVVVLVGDCDGELLLPPLVLLHHALLPLVQHFAGGDRVVVRQVAHQEARRVGRSRLERLQRHVPEQRHHAALLGVIFCLGQNLGRRLPAQVGQCLLLERLRHRYNRCREERGGRGAALR
mmetsp:Transcript_5365/g.13582  ORF Transcript_5365/g.13582 Transcript_5365/m.13582 type:complete len:216 (-) Transcript_5365:136-783(-)